MALLKVRLKCLDSMDLSFQLATMDQSASVHIWVRRRTRMQFFFSQPIIILNAMITTNLWEKGWEDVLVNIP